MAFAISSRRLNRALGSLITAIEEPHISRFQCDLVLGRSMIKRFLGSVSSDCRG